LGILFLELLYDELRGYVCLWHAFSNEIHLGVSVLKANPREFNGRASYSIQSPLFRGIFGFGR
jgi:hypothetical protein